MLQIMIIAKFIQICLLNFKEIEIYISKQLQTLSFNTCLYSCMYKTMVN